MIPVAGRFSRVMPILTGVPASTIGGGLAASGLNVLGNVVTGEIENKPASRIIAEAIGAGGLGAGVGYALGRDRSKVSRVVNDSIDRKKADIALEINSPDTYRELTDNLNNEIRDINRFANQLYGGAGGINVLVGGGIGGMLGGGAANIAQIPQTQAIDGDPQIEQYLAAIQASNPRMVS
jgi:hypothetical protein